MSMNSATDETFEDEINVNIPVVVKLGAAWCTPCRTLTPILQDFAEKYEGVVKVLDVDIEKAPNLANFLKISSVPFIVVFQNGKVTYSKAGFSGRADIEKLFDSLVG